MAERAGSFYILRVGCPQPSPLNRTSTRTEMEIANRLVSRGNFWPKEEEKAKRAGPSKRTNRSANDAQRAGDTAGG